MRLRWAVEVGAWGPEPPEIDFLLSLLPPEERQQCTRFRQPADQQRAIVSRLLQRRAAAAALNVPAATVHCSRTRGGKPYVHADTPRPPAAPNWNYSVSHEGDYVILAAEPLCVCGCDVAAPRQTRPQRRCGSGGPRGQQAQQEPLHEFFAAFHQQFTATEWGSIRRAGDEAAQEAQFRRLWSLKEAFVKATGEGLGFELRQVEFAINSSGNTAVVSVQGVPQRDWTFHLHELGKGHWAAVARAPLTAVVDAWGGFKATFGKASFSDGEWQQELRVPEPPFTLLSLSDLLEPGQQREAYEAAGGDVL